MKTTLAPCLALFALLSVPACEIHLHDGVSYHETDGVLYADDVPLRYERWVKVESVPTKEVLQMGTSSGPISISSGDAPEACVIEAHLFSEVEGDGTVGFEGGKLKATSATQHGVAINGIRGSVPAGSDLEIDTGTGELTLGEFKGGNVELTTGTSFVVAKACTVKSLAIDTGTGDIEVTDLTSPSLRISSGTGDAALSGCKVDQLQFESGTGDLTIDASQFKRSTLESGTGDIVLKHGANLGEESHDLGTGDLTVER